MQLALPLAPDPQDFGARVERSPRPHAEPRTHHPEPRTQHSAQNPALQNPAPLNPAPRTLNPEPDPVEFVRHPRARRYVICVRDDGSVRVTIPRGGSKREAQAFAEQQRPWIARERRRVAREQAAPREVMPADMARRLRAQAKRDLPARLLELAAVHGLNVSRISVRNQRWRWGSCSRSSHICLNWRLVQMPAEVRDYVMLHELMHLKRMDHSPRFWKLVAAACPEYQGARRWLRDNGEKKGREGFCDTKPLPTPF